MSASFKIGNRIIGRECESFIIAEAGINHNGDFALAKQMVLAAKEAGADTVNVYLHFYHLFRPQPLYLFFSCRMKHVAPPVPSVEKKDAGR